MAVTNIKEKTTDLPPRGARNADPITNEAGAHPIETGIGTAAGGAAAGFAAGIVAGPIGAVVGAVVGGVAGGLAGKATGEWIDPTIDPTFQNAFVERDYVQPGETFQDYAPAYQHGGQSEHHNVGMPFSEAEARIQKEYETSMTSRSMPWTSARPAVQDAYNRARQIRDERLSK